MSDPAHVATDEAIKELEKRIYRSYEQATKEMLQKQKQFMKEYEAELADMRFRYKAGMITEAKFDAWKLEQTVTRKWFDDLLNTLAFDAMDADRHAAAIINKQLPKTYATNFNYATYQIEHGTAINTAFTLYDENTVSLLLENNPKLFQRAAVDELKDMAWNRQKIASALTQGILQGESMDGVAARLMNVFGMDYNAAVRTARTCMTGAQNAGRLDSYERAQKMGIDGKKRWVAALDDRTRESHLQLDGEAVDIREPFSNGLDYPGDESTGDPAEYMNCRCTMVYEFDGTDYDNAQRDDRLNAMDFDTWLEEHHGI